MRRVKRKRDATESLRAVARQHYLAGDFQAAIAVQLQVVNARTAAGAANAGELKVLSLYTSHAGDAGSAIQILAHLAAQGSRDVEVYHNLGVLHSRRGEFRQALAALEQALTIDPDFAGLHDAMNTACCGLGDHVRAREHGRHSLLAKDAHASAQTPARAMPAAAPAPFDPCRPEDNAIAFSLWGEAPRYLEGALRNAELAADLYPGWHCRFYHDDTVPETVLEQLRAHGAQTLCMPRAQRFYSGLFWRFQVVNDPAVARFLVRDCDSVFTVKERVAVDAWLDSDRYFHIMRDWYTHCDLILAGLWGGVGGVLPDLQALLSAYVVDALPVRTINQRFLRERLWSTVKQSCLIHDSIFGLPGSEPFPPYGHLPPGRHVGDVATLIECRYGVPVTA